MKQKCTIISFRDSRKSSYFAKQLNPKNFQASDGWHRRWKERNNISLKTVSRESKSVTPEMVNARNGQKRPFQLFLSNYDLKDIYNANKFGLFYQCFPNKIYQLKSEKCYGGKLSKICITDMTAEMFWAKVTQVRHWEWQESTMLKKCQVFATEINGKVGWMGNCLKSGSESWTGRLLLKEEMLLLW